MGFCSFSKRALDFRSCFVGFCSVFWIRALGLYGFGLGFVGHFWGFMWLCRVLWILRRLIKVSAFGWGF